MISRLPNLFDIIICIENLPDEPTPKFHSRKAIEDYVASTYQGEPTFTIHYESEYLHVYKRVKESFRSNTTTAVVLHGDDVVFQYYLHQ